LENEPSEIYDIAFQFPNAEFVEKYNIDFPVNDIKTIVKIRDGFKCVSCQASIDIEVHHIIPRNRGGPDKINNLITLCRKCHAQQHPYLSHLFIGSLPAERTDYLGRFKHFLKKKLHLIDTYEKYINFFTQGKSTHLREGQKEVIDAIIKGKNILAIRPTGSGKSVIFQIPTLMKDIITIVITPLKALMVDQVYNLRQKGIPAIYLNSDIHKQDRLNILKLAASGAFKFIYLAPERIIKGNTDELELLKNVKADMVVIDEAHTRDTWSAFRPAYKELKQVCNFFNPKQILGFTATANREVIDILQHEFRFDCVFYQGFDRPNIFLDIKMVNGGKDDEIFNNKMAFVIQFVSDNPHLKTVVFSPTISICETIYDGLPTSLKRRTSIFHSKINTMERTNTNGICM
jgi:ATP-dependent DNA helicase RecQ